MCDRAPTVRVQGRACAGIGRPIVRSMTVGRVREWHRSDEPGGPFPMFRWRPRSVLTTDQLPLAAALAAARAVAPPGVELRSWRDEHDYDAMVDIFHRARVVDGTGWELSTDGLVADLRALATRPEDSILIAEADGRMVGWIRAWDFGCSPDEGRQL